jgi:HD-GYP domain-containing protein (c-di-GMP phosphodiesterase class II)
VDSYVGNAPTHQVSAPCCGKPNMSNRLRIGHRAIALRFPTEIRASEGKATQRNWDRRMFAKPLSQPIQVLGCLAFGGDLSMGQPIDHSPRTALLANKILMELGYGVDVASRAGALSLIRWAGCTANAQGFAELFGDDIACRAAIIENRNPLAGKGQLSGPLDVYLRPLAMAQCEATIEIVKQLGLSSDVGVGASDLFEHWNGSGIPAGKKHEDVNLLAQVVSLASDTEILSRVFGLGKALHAIESRGGAYYDPALARVAQKHAPDWLSELSQIDAWPEAAFNAENALVNSEISADGLTRLLADYADLKVPRHFQVSRKASEMTATVTSMIGMRGGAALRVERAALFHGLGRVAVPNATLEREGMLTEADNEYTRLIPYWTERILKRAPDFETEATLAAQAFERLDGTGFPKGLRGRALSEEAQVLQSCVFVATSWHEQNCRESKEFDAIERRISAEVTAGRLNKLYTDAALAACGRRKVPPLRSQSMTLHITDREREVLVYLARGLTNKEIARVLSISPSTAGTHVENLYRKLEVSTRAAAALAALRLDLVDI